MQCLFEIVSGIIKYMLLSFLSQGIERFSSYAGYGKTFEFASDFKDKSQVSPYFTFDILLMRLREG